MSEFWKLWNEAAAGDSNAAHQANLLIAKHEGYEVEDLKGDPNGIIVRIRRGEKYRYGKSSWTGYRSYAEMFEDQWFGVPQYLQSLDVALTLATNHRLVLDIEARTVVSPETTVEIEHLQGAFGKCTARTPAMALCGAWWEIMTGEMQP